MPPSTPALRIEALTKRYGALRALDDVSFSVASGDIFALLGPNGAGKTTLIGVVAGLVRATSGRVLVHGRDVERGYRDTRRLVGLVPQEIDFDPFFTPLEALRFQRGFMGLPDAPALYEEILRNLDLWGKRDAYTRTLSGGMKRRLLVAKALVHEPRVLFLDEPTAGVDVALRQDLWSYVRRLRASGVTVVLTTHYLEEAEKLADRVAIVDRGRLKLIERTRTLVGLHGSGRTRVRFEGPPERLSGGLAALRDGDALVLEDDAALDATLAALHACGLRITDVVRHPTRLEDVFLAVVREEGGPTTGRAPAAGPAPAASEREAPSAGAAPPEPALAPMRLNVRGFATLLRREVERFLSVPAQTLASPIITTALYFLVFGYSLGVRVREMGTPYVQFILPGLVMLGVIGTSFLNTSSSLFGAKVNGTVVDVLVAPLSAAEIVGAMGLATLVRAFLVGGATWSIGALFVGPQLAHPAALAAFVVLVSVTMACLGLVVAVFAQKFEQLSAPTTYLLTPLTYLGGVFYSLDTLPEPWHALSLWNPIVYLVNGLRWGMAGVSDVPIGRALVLATCAAAALATTAWALLRAGTGLRQ